MSDLIGAIDSLLHTSPDLLVADYFRDRPTMLPFLNDRVDDFVNWIHFKYCKGSSDLDEMVNMYLILIVPLLPAIHPLFA
jgi:hypothetical protein